MQGAYGGLVVIINYASIQQADEQEYTLLTEANVLILTESSQNILVEVP